ncbi:hypothetical protein [Nocardia transvalensis]|uniref:hypothetical protein n=1 Tax=Nocardia transvalensis TaxID=37333 RepID=UPI001E408BB4|nr:hypothetical protein [Nocardia transvalensis]
MSADPAAGALEQGAGGEGSVGGGGPGDGVAGHVAGDLGHGAGGHTGDLVGFEEIGDGVAADLADQVLGAGADRCGDPARQGTRAGGCAHRTPVDTALAVTLGDFDALRGQICTGTKGRTERRACCDLRSQSGGHPQRGALSKKGCASLREVLEQLHRGLADDEFDRGGGRGTGDRPETGNEGDDQRAQRNVDGEFGVLDIGGAVFELFGEAVADRDQALQVAAVAAGDLVPVAVHRGVGPAVDRRQRRVHGRVGGLPQLS